MFYQPLFCRFVLSVVLTFVTLVALGPGALASERWDFQYGDGSYHTLREAEAAMEEANDLRGKFLVHTDTSVSRDSRTLTYEYSIEAQPIRDLTPIKYFLDLAGGTFDCGNGDDGCASPVDAIEYTYNRIVQAGRCDVEYQAPGPNSFWEIAWKFAAPVRETVNVWFKAPMEWEWGTHLNYDPDQPCGQQQDHHAVLKTVERGYCPPGLPPRTEAQYFPDRSCWNPLTDHITAQLLQFCGPTEGNPCSPATGNKSLSQTDFSSPDLAIRRYFNSFNQFPSKAGLGTGWSHNFSERIQGLYAYSQYPLHLIDSRGHYERFEPMGDFLWRSVNQRNLTIERIDSGWVLKRPNGKLEYFSRVGKLVEIKRLDAPVGDLVLAYEGGKLATVTADSGRKLQFVYSGDNLSSVLLPSGSAIQFTQDNKENLIAVEYPDGSHRGYLYENAAYPHALTGIVDELGNRYATYRYDERGRAVGSEHAGGAGRVQLNYESDGTTTVKRATGASVRYEFGNDPFISAEAIEDPAGATQATHDSLGRLISRTDRNGHTTTFAYDLGLVAEKREAIGTPSERSTRYQWDQSAGRRASMTVGDLRTLYVYDEQGRRTERSLLDTADPSVPVRQTRYTYYVVAPGVERRVSTDGPRLDVSDVTYYRYYDHDDSGGAFRIGDLWQLENAVGQVTEFTHYDAAGRVAEFRNANGVTTSIDYDPRGRIRSRIVQDPATGATAVTKFTYDAAGNLTRVARPDGSFIQYEYDAAHRLVAIEDSLGNRTEYALDPAGQRVGETVLGPDGGVFKDTARQFDSLGRLVRELNGVGDAKTHSYDAEGNLKSSTDSAGDTTRFQYDTLDRLRRTLDALGGVTNYTYDAQDRLRSVSDPRGVTTNYVYDAVGNLLAEASPDAGTTTNTHDAAGNRVRSVDARGNLVERDYDVLNRVTAIRYPDNGTGLHFSYDQGVFGQGRLTGFTDPTGSAAYGYDYQGHLTTDHRVVAGTSLHVDYVYDAAGNRIGMTYPSGLHLDINRDRTGRISAISLADNGTNKTIVSDIQYAPFGPMRQLTWEDGTILTRQFDSAGRLVEQQSGGVQHLTWSYAQDGDITAIQDLLDASKSQEFGYDALKRLTHADGPYGTLDYAYDAVGNRTQLIHNGATTSYSYAADSNRLLQAGNDEYAYDATGNTTHAGDLTLSYSVRGRLARATPAHGKAGEYDYNALGQRVIKAVNRKITLFAYDLNGHLIGEYGGGEPIREYVYLKDTPIALLRPKGQSTEVLYIHTDNLGTPKLVTNDSRQIRWQNNRRPFGEGEARGKGIELRLGFPGQREDESTEYYYNFFRFYSPGLGRYLTPDPTGFMGGLDRYWYVGNNPIGRKDAYGLFWLWPLNPLNPLPPGNFQPGYSAQDEICSPPADGLNGNVCFRRCCQSHDDCYRKNRCNATSWFNGGFQPCQLCNFRAELCIAHAAFFGCSGCNK